MVNNNNDFDLFFISINILFNKSKLAFQTHRKTIQLAMVLHATNIATKMVNENLLQIDESQYLSQSLYDKIGAASKDLKISDFYIESECIITAHKAVQYFNMHTLALAGYNINPLNNFYINFESLI